MLAVAIDHQVSGRREVLVAFQECDSFVQNARCAARLRGRRWLQRVVEVEKVGTLVHDTDVVFEDLAECWRAVAGHATLETVEAGELIRELGVKEKVAGGVLILPFIILVTTTVNDICTSSHVSRAIVEI